MSSELRLKKLRGSGGYVMAQVTDEQQSKGSLGGPDLFLAPIGRLDPASISKHHCNACEKDFEGSPKIDYSNPNEQVAENLTLVERGKYLCRCGSAIAEYRKFSNNDSSRGAGAAYTAEQMARAAGQGAPGQQRPQEPQRAPEPRPAEAPRPQEAAPPAEAQRAPSTPGGATPVNAIAGLHVYDQDAQKVGTASQVGIDASHTIVLVITKDDGTETTVPWSLVKKVGQIIVLGGQAPAPAQGKCPGCGFANKAGAKFCEECGTSV